eukprot:Clim_evm7s243 gene=Clim_evmTU7s243
MGNKNRAKNRKHHNGGPKPQAGVVPVKHWDDPEQRVVLMVTTRTTGRWTFPKGSIKSSENAEAAAVREAKEEAGVIGTCSARLGTFKDGDKNNQQITYFLMNVTEQLQEFDEAGVRKLEWVSLEKAEEMAEKKFVKDVVTELKKRVGQVPVETPKAEEEKKAEPESATAAATGTAAAVKTESTKVENKASSASEKISEAVKPAEEKAKAAAEEVKGKAPEPVKKAVEEAEKKVEEVTKEAETKVEEATKDVEQKVKEVKDKAPEPAKGAVETVEKKATEAKTEVAKQVDAAEKKVEAVAKTSAAKPESSGDQSNPPIRADKASTNSSCCVIL